LPQIAKRVNSDFLNGFTVFQVAQKRVWHESLVWSQAVVNADDFDRFKALECRQIAEKMEQQIRTRVFYRLKFSAGASPGVPR
jgi:hypothetical protein